MPRDDDYATRHASRHATHHATHHVAHLPPSSRVATRDDHATLLVGPPPWQVAAARKAGAPYGVARRAWLGLRLGLGLGLGLELELGLGLGLE